MTLAIILIPAFQEIIRSEM
uniref:Uncharacterized protein n=1 Tax=Anguilla anguilla TaxID=7936 RepID=A0A0E9UXA4_ANGAN